MEYYKYAFTFTIIGLIASAYIGSLSGTTLMSLWSCFILAILEISLSFDNAIVNAKIVKSMPPKWQRAFLVWGILIAVFGMRILFPIIIVMFISHHGFIDVIMLLFYKPKEYMSILEHSKVALNVLGGSFLSLVALSYFINSNEKTWLGCVENKFKILQKFKFMPLLINLVIAAIVYSQTPNPTGFLPALLISIILFYALKLIEFDDKVSLNKSGLSSFLYLEVLDASFSFDGVLGAFALSSNFLIISIGLAIGAFYVRSFTIMLVEKNSLVKYPYVEHGAYYAILALAIIMYIKINYEISEFITGGLSFAFILASFISSIRSKSLTA